MALIGSISWAEEDRIIAGRNLAIFWDALQSSYVSIENTELKSQILSHSLSAILIPGTQAKDHPVVKCCFQQKTIFDPDLNVSENDYKELMNYAKDKVFELIQALVSAMDERDGPIFQTAIDKLDQYLTDVPSEKRFSAQVYTGALLADKALSMPEVSDYVMKFRDNMKMAVQTALKNPVFANKLETGVPYSFGSRPFSAADLSKINPANVQLLSVDKRSYRTVWVGSTLVITAQQTPPIEWWDSTGLGLAHEWANKETWVMDKSVPNFPKQLI